MHANVNNYRSQLCWSSGTICVHQAIFVLYARSHAGDEASKTAEIGILQRCCNSMFKCNQPMTLLLCYFYAIIYYSYIALIFALLDGVQVVRCLQES